MGIVIPYLLQAGGAEGLDVGDVPRNPIYSGEQGELEAGCPICSGEQGGLD